MPVAPTPSALRCYWMTRLGNLRTQSQQSLPQKAGTSRPILLSRNIVQSESTFENCLVRGICGSLMRSNGGRKLDSPGRRTPDSSESAFCVRGQLALEPRCLPGKRYAVLQESSAPRADEHAISDTWRSRQPGSLRAMPSPFETACAIWKG